MSLNTSTDLPEPERITDAQLLELIVFMAEEHGITYSASPTRWQDVSHHENVPAIAKPIEYGAAQPYVLLPFESALTDPSNELGGFLLYEAHSTLCDTGLPYAETESPIIFGADGGVRANPGSPISLAVYLLTIDRTFEQLSKLLSPDFYESHAISTSWFARSLSTLRGQPQFNLSSQFSMSME